VQELEFVSIVCALPPKRGLVIPSRILTVGLDYHEADTLGSFKQVSTGAQIIRLSKVSLTQSLRTTQDNGKERLVYAKAWRRKSHVMPLVEAVDPS